jgi:hypothetical protein
MDDASSHDRKRKWFLWGMVLTSTLSIPLILGTFHSFRGISEEKAIGLGAVAGGIAETYVTFALILAFVLPIAAIVLLVKSFSGGHRTRALFSLLCILWNALMLALAGLFVWLSFIYLPHAQRNLR